MMKRELVLAGICLSLLVTSSYAVSLRDSVEMALNNNPDIIAERKNQEAYRKYVDEREGRYLPTLDIEAYLETSQEKQYPDNAASTNWASEDGYNAAIIFRQYLYDGGQTPSQVSESKHQDLANKHRSLYAIENTILETIKSYTSLVQFDERLGLSADTIKNHEENLVIAKEKEEISGEVLETYQVASKLHFVTDSYIEEQDLKDTAIATYTKFVGLEPTGSTCRPVIDETKVPATLEEAIETAVLKNHRILEEIENIKVQREKIAQYDSTFLPSLNLELKASIDDDLELNENGKTKDWYGRINLNWNLFNGNRDKIRSEQEELFLQEHQKTLEEITNDVISEVKSTYGKYFKNKQRIEALKKYVNANVNIAEVYRSEFEAGTRTFVDILDAESELYSSSKGLINMEHAALNNYYDLMFNLSMLSDAILASTNQNCANVAPRKIDYTPDNTLRDTSSELEGLISDGDSALINNEFGIDNSTIIAQEELISSDVVSSIDTQTFLNAPKSYFTINLATKKGLDSANKYIAQNNLGEQAYTFGFGKDMRSAKVLYGVFSSVKEAKEALKTLSPAVLAAKPYIDNISKHQALYLKYN